MSFESNSPMGGYESREFFDEHVAANNNIINFVENELLTHSLVEQYVGSFL